MAIGSGSYFVGCGASLLLIFIQIILHDVPFLSKEPYRSMVKINTSHYDSIITELFNMFNEEKIKVLNVKIGKSKDNTKVELDLLFPPGYEKNKLIIKWSADKRIDSISG